VATSAPSQLKQYGLYIAGQRVEALQSTRFESISPLTGQPWASIPDAGADDVDHAVAAASSAFTGDWRALTPTRRGRLMLKVAEMIAEHAEQIAIAETRENGKLYKEMLAQIRRAPDWFYYFGGLADKIEGTVIPLDVPNAFNYTLREPVGVVGVVVPWNSPVLIVTQTIAPALAAGNTVVIKPSEIASAGILEFAELFDAAGFPPGVVNVVTGGPETGAALVGHPDVAKISFTGGSAAGRRVAETAGARLARVTLELGGKSPNIVFADADQDAALAGVLAGIFGAAGQTCVAGSRVLVESSIYDEFSSRLRERTRAIRLGDPMDPSTDMGPIASEQQLEKIASFVEGARRAGATILSGGQRAEVDIFPAGYFYEPTLLGDLGNDSEVVREEVFGPVAALIPFASEEEAVEIANASSYGLASGIWTLNVKRAHRVARRLEAGIVWVNTYRAVTFNSPFGGYKASGMGRINGVEAVNEFLQVKSVWCELGDEIHDPFVMRS
jgi:acyl-CoA reductase-like NAD-dependent aldehyde dehydrogenase